ncbi:hypothetical protein GCM10028867_19900 [Nocardioides pacificus]
MTSQNPVGRLGLTPARPAAALDPTTRTLDERPALQHRLHAALAAALVSVIALGVGAVSLGGSSDAAVAAPLLRDDRFSQLSGVSRSTYQRDVLWTVGGSADEPSIRGVGADGSTVARLAVAGAAGQTWQNVAAGPQHTLWLAGAGQVRNGAAILTVHRVSEPSNLTRTRVKARKYRLRVPGTAAAQSLLVQPSTGRLFVATQGTNQGALYVAPRTVSSRRVNVLTRVGAIPAGITGGAFDTRGRGLVLVDAETSYFYSAPGVAPTSQALPTTTATGVSLDRFGGSLLISSARDRAIYRSPIAPESWSRTPRPPAPSTSAPSTATPTAGPTGTPTQGPSTSTPTSTPTTPVPEPTASPTQPIASGPMTIGLYKGSFSYESFKTSFGAYPAVETTYLNADQVTTPNISRHQAQIDRGISPVITLGYKNGPFTRAEIAAWGPTVQEYFRGFVSGLKTLSDYAAAADNGTRVYFADEHEPQIKINQDKYAYTGYGASQKPTTEQSAAAWNKVMGQVRTAAPAVVRTYWYGGSGAGEDAYARLLEPSLIQMATFDPYRWKHNSPSDTPEKLFGPKIAALKAQPWMRNADGSLKPWGLTEWGTDASLGDASNATFVTAASALLRQQGASFAVYFNRIDGNDTANNFIIDDGSQPRTLAAFRSALTQ